MASRNPSSSNIGLKRKASIGLMVGGSCLALALSFQNCAKGPSSYDGSTASSLGANDVLMNAPVTITPDSPNAEQLLGVTPTTALIDAASRKVILFTGAKDVLSNVLIPVDTTKKYRVSGSARSLGTVPSRLYLGLATYDANFKHIAIHEVLRNEASVTGITSAIGQEITTIADITGKWTLPPQPAYARMIGFYFDGDTTKRPDFILGTDSTNNSYSTASTVGAYGSANASNIHLNLPIPADMSARITASTKIMNHSSGSTYVYAAASNVEVPNTVTAYQGTLTGEAFGGGTTNFRPGTKYVRFLILGNYQQTTDSQLIIENLTFEEIP